jgi:hypothetical protein
MMAYNMRRAKIIPDISRSDDGLGMTGRRVSLDHYQSGDQQCTPDPDLDPSRTAQKEEQKQAVKLEGKERQRAWAQDRGPVSGSREAQVRSATAAKECSFW